MIAIGRADDSDTGTRRRTAHRPRWTRAPLLMVFVLCLLGGGSAAQASSVRAVSVQEMLTAAELVFEGQVVGQQVRRGARKRDIYTEVTFEVLDVVKGDYADPYIVLEFSGGTLGGETVEVTDLHRPSVGERGIYFVESLRRRQVHPLYGWGQGHLLIENDPRTARPLMKTRDRRDIFGVSAESGFDSRRDGLSKGVAAGLRVQRGLARETPMTSEEFKGNLRRMLKDVER